MKMLILIALTFSSFSYARSYRLDCNLDQSGLKLTMFLTLVSNADNSISLYEINGSTYYECNPPVSTLVCDEGDVLCQQNRQQQQQCPQYASQQVGAQYVSLSFQSMAEIESFVLNKYCYGH